MRVHSPETADSLRCAVADPDGINGLFVTKLD
jgi:hypothetical protein